MGIAIQKIDTNCPNCPASLWRESIASHFPTCWAIGNLDILDMELLSLFCSIRCPGDIILKTYDCMCKVSTIYPYR
jgi:hypothetical protein